LDDRADQIARDFISRYEAEWSNGAEAVSRLYTAGGVLVGFVTAVGRSQICELLRGIIGQGWTSIRIKIVNVRQVGGLILIANEYVATGSGKNAGNGASLTPRARLCAREVTARGASREAKLRMGSRRWEALRQGPARWDRAGPRHWAAAEPRPLSTQRAAAARRLRRARDRGRP
jgi:hypothetical protein